MGGYPLDYQFTAAQSQDCIVMPIQDVRYYSPEGLRSLRLWSLSRPPRSLRTPSTRPSSPPICRRRSQGLLCHPVETGLSDETMVEIKSGLNDGDKVYNNTPKENYYGRTGQHLTKAG